MRYFALIGFPLGHSLSASYFGEKFAREGIDAEYSPLAIERAEEVLPHCEHLSGFNVTIPHKQAIMPFLSAISEEAQAIGAVNCVKVTPEGLIGYNTDVEGMRAALAHYGISLKKKSVLILGTGGTSRTAAAVARHLGAGEILLTSMDADGTKNGFDLALTDAVTRSVGIPVIASGGCGKLSDFSDVFQKTGADAALAASLFHYKELTVSQVKDHLAAEGIPVRR